MKTSSHFSSRTSALVLWSVLTASTLFAGVTLAQSLNIPTNLDNAVITIQRIFLSSNGVSTLLSDDHIVGFNEASIELSGANGSITTRWDNADLTIGGKLQFTHSNYQCPYGSTDCVLSVDWSGTVILSWTANSGNDSNIFKRTAANPNNIFLAKNDGDVASVGNNPTTQSYLRVGAVSATDNEVPDKSDTALVVAGRTETRGGILIRRDNDDNTPSNIWTNRNTILENNFTELDMFNQAGKINFKSAYDNGISSSNPTSFLFSANGASTKVGINFNSASSNTVERNPAAELHVAEGGKFMVGYAPGAPSFCDTSGTCTSDQTTNTLIVDSTTRKVGIGLSDSSGPDANLHVAGMSDTFLVWWGPAEWQCVRTDASNAWLSSYISRCTNTQTCQDLYGGSAVCTLDTYVVGASTVTTDNTALSANNATRKVWVKTFAPVKDFDVRGTASVSTSLIVGHAPNYDPGTDKIAVNGSTRANAYYYNSDRRYKSDIEVLKSPLENLLKLSGYKYFNKLSNKQDLWVIAQEVEAVYPELVQTDADGYKSVEYGNLVAPIIEAIKELATKIDNLFTLYVSQQAKIDTLEARLLKLEAQVK